MAKRAIWLTGFLLAGGASRRMGQPKEALTIGGETMLSRELRVLRCVARQVAIVGFQADSPKLHSGQSRPGPPVADPQPVPVLRDLLPARGPLGGIYTGLSWTRTEFNLFLACDVPFISSRFLSFLRERAWRCQADVTMPESPDGRSQPLCAVYRRRVLKLVRARLLSGENKVSGFFSGVHCNVIPWADAARAGFRPRIFDNMNTPDDYELARRRIEELKGQLEYLRKPATL